MVRLKPAQIARIGALGAFGVSLGLATLFALFVVFTIPRGGSGMDWTHAQLAWIGVGGVVAVLILIHLVFARILLRASKDEGKGE